MDVRVCVCECDQAEGRLSRKAPISLSTHPLPPPFQTALLFTLASFLASKPLNIHTQLAIKSHPPLYLEDVWCFGCGFRY